ncbi:MAG TPA: hypothetical protein PLX89_05980 [Verrucomicrobiota bacterium]|nr:hypothetical protein [Verrucomicrobiales bacterium]HRI12538.1 hypothetical protein [Verrucomicrobiota bacterium]
MRIAELRKATVWLVWVSLVSWAGWAGVPQPMCIFYGQAVDGYGLPYTTNATVILRRGSNEIARHVIRGSLTPGVNFVLYAHLDEGRTTNYYTTRAVRSGESVSIVVRDLEGEKLIMERPVPPVSRPGTQISIHATAAEDEDGDGLPDPWERELITWSGGQLNNLAEVRGEDDLDGDGQTNLQEYQAGTFPFFDRDLFFAEETTLTPNGNIRITFWSIAGKVYLAECVADPSQPEWNFCPWALSDTGPTQAAPVEGTGDWLSLYLPIETDFRLFRLVVK